MSKIEKVPGTDNVYFLEKPATQPQQARSIHTLLRVLVEPADLEEIDDDLRAAEDDEEMLVFGRPIVVKTNADAHRLGTRLGKIFGFLR